MTMQDLTGYTLGQYQLRELIGAGGMGAVYHGYQTNLERAVAVKVLSTSLAAETDYVARFYHEAKTSAALEHSHIVPVYDYGIQDNLSYVVMRLLTGGTLDERLYQHTHFEAPLPSLREVATLLAQMGDALDYAHSKAVIHRDIKPSNIMFDNQGKAYLVDFGIAKLLEATSALTGTGTTMGTPAFMPPEQWQSQDLTPAADQYGLAITIYMLLVGRLPYQANSPFGLMNKHLYEMPTPPHVERPDIPAAVSLVLEQALAKDPTGRYPTVTAFAQAFSTAVRGHSGEVTGFFVAKLPSKEPSTLIMQSGRTPRFPPPASVPTPPTLIPGPSTPHVFIAYSREDFPFVQRLMGDLQSSKIDVYIGQEGLKPGTTDWEQALRDAIDAAQAVLLVASPDSRKSPYVRDELAIAKAKGKTIYPVWVKGDVWIDSIPMGLGHTQYIDARGSTYASGLQKLINVVHGEPVTLADRGRSIEVDEPILVDPTAPPRNPYKGLAPFRAQDQRDFFGRTVLVNELVELLGNAPDNARFLAVIGPSGSGKSSVVMAGLLPALQNGALEDSQDWVYLEPIIPGGHPIENLVVALARVLPQKAHPVIQDSLNASTMRGLHMLGQEIITQPTGRLVLYVDQFEETFTLTQTETERQQFINLLTTAASEPNGRVIVILSMRADFYDRPMQYGELCTLMENHAKSVPPMTLADLYEVVQEPANLPDVHLEFDEGLVTELIFAVRNETGGLPLLQFTLDQLFEYREDHCLTRAAYEQIGGVRGALRSHAENIYNTLPSEKHRQMARALFLRLLEPGATEQDTTRRRAALTELELPDDADSTMMIEAAEAFTHARLLVADMSGDDITLEVAHEALIREWARLSEWLHDAREDVRLQKAISADAAEWARRGKRADDDMLYRGTVLDEAREWAKRNAASIHEMVFLDASHQDELARLAREKRRNLLLRIAWAVFVVALVGTLGFLFWQNDGLQTDKRLLEDDRHIQGLRTGRIVTLAEGGSFVADPFPDQTGPEIIATVARIAELNAWQPVITQDDFGTEMVEVPPGCFWMGSVSGDSSGQPVHEVCFDEPFWIDRYEVTHVQYAACVAAGLCLAQVQDYGDEFNDDQQPVVGVTWLQADAYCAWRNAALPTEAQWEYAARGVDSRVYPWGNEWVEDNAVTGFSVVDAPAEVGTKPEGASWVGALDMSGNVWEWIDDWYDEDYYQTFAGTIVVNPVGPKLGEDRVLRGGSWRDIYTENLRNARREYDTPVIGTQLFGFRCVRSQ